MKMVTAGILCFGLLIACTPSSVQPDPPVPVMKSTNIPPYRASYFPSAWAKVHGLCDTREVEFEKASSHPIDTDGDGCNDDGSFVDVYTGNIITAKQSQIDHVFSKKQAWYAGLYKLTQAQRAQFFNDQLNLLPVTSSVNESKGDRGPSQWSPPNKSGDCRYAQIYRDTAKRWNLVILPSDEAALQRLSVGCG